MQWIGSLVSSMFWLLCSAAHEQNIEKSLQVLFILPEASSSPLYNKVTRFAKIHRKPSDILQLFSSQISLKENLPVRKGILANYRGPRCVCANIKLEGDKAVELLLSVSAVVPHTQTADVFKQEAKRPNFTCMWGCIYRQKRPNLMHHPSSVSSSSASREATAHQRWTLNVL